jgi:hypothetical protein
VCGCRARSEYWERPGQRATKRQRGLCVQGEVGWSTERWYALLSIIEKPRCGAATREAVAQLVEEAVQGLPTPQDDLNVALRQCRHARASAAVSQTIPKPCFVSFPQNLPLLAVERQRGARPLTDERMTEWGAIGSLNNLSGEPDGSIRRCRPSPERPHQCRNLEYVH